MLDATLNIIRTCLKSDPTLSPADRSRILSAIRNGADGMGDALPADVPHLIRRTEAARRLGYSLQFVDQLAASGVLPKRKLPGRRRAAGFLESDLNMLIAGQRT
jgi:hypothetical protein